MGDPWVFYATAPPVQLVWRLRLEDHAHSPDTAWLAMPVEEDASQTDAREVPGADQPGQQIEVAVGTTRRRWIEDTLHFMWIPWVGLHDGSQAADTMRERGGVARW
jgi:hypothetical protein